MPKQNLQCKLESIDPRHMLRIVHQKFMSWLVTSTNEHTHRPRRKGWIWCDDNAIINWRQLIILSIYIQILIKLLDGSSGTYEMRKLDKKIWNISEIAWNICHWLGSSSSHKFVNTCAHMTVEFEYKIIRLTTG